VAWSNKQVNKGWSEVTGVLRVRAYYCAEVSFKRWDSGKSLVRLCLVCVFKMALIKTDFEIDF
jgi:hypothetical protein